MGTKGETLVFCRHALQLIDLLIINEYVQINSILLKVYTIYEVFDPIMNNESTTVIKEICLRISQSL